MIKRKIQKWGEGRGKASHEYLKEEKKRELTQSD